MGAGAAGDIPLCVQGCIDNPYAFAIIGTWRAGRQQFFCPPTADCFWFCVFDLTSLKQVASFTAPSTSTSVPPELQSYLGKPGYALVFLTTAVPMHHAPQGALYDALLSMGAGAQLKKLEQLAEQYGSGSVGRCSYVLACSTDTADPQGFEDFSWLGQALLTLWLRPITVQGKTTYFLIQL
jgi:hypothetical protein